MARKSAHCVEAPPGPLDPFHLDRNLALLADPDVTRWSTLKKLLRVVALAAETFGGCDVTVTLRGHQGEVCTNGAAYLLDYAQHQAGSGPCIEAAALRRAVRVDAIETCPWREYRGAAAEHQIASSLSIPLVHAERVIGMLSLYSGRTHAFAHCEASACQFAAAVAATLAPYGSTL
jgi:GAF domain-containing protein